MRALPLTLLLFSVGCAGGEDAVEKQRAAIVSGELGGSASVIGFTATAPCSAVLVAPRVALTAAHCVELAFPRELRAGPSLADSVALPVAHVRVHSRYVSALGERDLALMLLAVDAPVTPVPALGAVENGAMITVVGFGRAAASGAAGERRTGTMRVESLDADSFRATPSPSVTCGGDSGGAAFDAAGALVGIVSSGDVDCARVSQFVRLDDDARAFIATVLADVARTDVPAGERCYRDESCASRRCYGGRNGVGLCINAGETPSPLPGERGSDCEAAHACDSRFCAAAAGETPRCTIACARDEVCGEGQSCVARGDGYGRVCAPRVAETSGGCGLSGAPADRTAAFAIGLCALVLSSRMRRAAGSIRRTTERPQQNLLGVCDENPPARTGALKAACDRTYRQRDAQVRADIGVELTAAEAAGSPHCSIALTGWPRDGFVPCKVACRSVC